MDLGGTGEEPAEELKPTTWRATTPPGSFPLHPTDALSIVADFSPSFFDLLDRLRGSTARRSPRHDDEASSTRGAAITLCVLTSALLWFTFTMREQYTDTLYLPTQLAAGTLSAEEALVTTPPEQVRVQVQADGYKLMQLHFNLPTLVLDATAESVDMAELVAQELSKDVQLSGVTPATVQLRREATLRKRIPVRLRGAIGKPDEYRFVIEPRLIPDSVWVSGAESVVESLEAWPTREVAIEAVRDTVRRIVSLADTLDTLVDVEPAVVTLEAATAFFTWDERTVDIRVEGKPSTEALVNFDPSVVTVSYWVRLDHYNDAQQDDDFYATVDYESILSDTTGRIEPSLHLPPELDIREAEIETPTLRYYNLLQEN